jgi:hypothetical protein
MDKDIDLTSFYLTGLNIKPRLYKSQLMRDYPRMSPLDLPVWERYLKDNSNKYISIAYDLPCGTGVDCTDEQDDNMRDMYKHLTMKRIDAIGFNKSYIDLIEVKPVADIRALGQLIAYKHFFMEQYKPSVPVNMILLCGAARPDDATVLQANNVKLYLV